MRESQVLEGSPDLHRETQVTSSVMRERRPELGLQA